MSKPVVHYKNLLDMAPLCVGGRAVLETLDHPRQDEFDLDEPVITSTIVALGPLPGEFETRNARYVSATD